MATETQLWTWLLFGGALKPQRAKVLLSEWESHGLTLQHVVRRLPADATVLNLTHDEAAKLRLPPQLPDTAAVRWNEPLYPQGLRDVPFKLRPALLFCSGEISLLMRPIIYFAPGNLSEDTKERLLEVVGMVVGENLLLAAFEDSPQAAMLLEELAASEGEILLFARQGLDQEVRSEQEQRLLDAGSLLRLTPLPPGSRANPAWNSVLEQVALATATRCIFSDPHSLPEPTPAAPSILLTMTGTTQMPGIQVVTNATDALTWLLDVPAAPPSRPGQSTPRPSTTRPGQALTTSDLEPPPTPGEMLRTLEKGGSVPEALRRRLLGRN